MRHRRLIFLLLGAAFVCAIVLLGLLNSAAKKQAISKNCASAITSICLGARLWAEDHDGRMPTNFICMIDEVNTPKILSCDHSRWATNWETFRPENTTYEILHPGMPETDTNTPFLRCKIHGHLGYSDSTVFDGVRRRTKFG